jgi:hypothetical protein
MFGGLAKLFKGDPSKKTQERLQPIVDAVNALDSQMQALSDDDLKAMTGKLKQRVASGESLEDVRAEAFAVRASATPQGRATWALRAQAGHRNQHSSLERVRTASWAAATPCARVSVYPWPCSIVRTHPVNQAVSPIPNQRRLPADNSSNL